MYAREEGVTINDENYKSNTSEDDVVIQRLDISDIDQIKQMSKLCIHTFYNQDKEDENASLLSR